jgi:GTP pyrophosphokinase
MHQHSEEGVAAHWRYKEGTRTDRKFDARIAWLRQVLAWKQELSTAEGVSDKVRQGLFDDVIYVLTPQGRVIDLPAGSTPVDFAYHVHTDLGHRCRGAKVDGHIVPLTAKLANAQRIEILSAKQGGPSRDWLNPQAGYLASPRALAKVRHWFRQEEFDRDVAEGKGSLEKELQRLGATGEPHDKVATGCGFAKLDEFFAALSRGEVTTRQIEVAVRGESAPAPGPEFVPRPATPTKGGTGVLVLGVNNIATLVAKCCKPLPPDPIVGFVTRGRGVMVHRLDCPNITVLRPEQRERLMPADWGQTSEASFFAEVEVVALDRQGLLRDISEAISRERINVTAVNTVSRGAYAFMRFTLQVGNAEHIQRVLRQVAEVPGVDTVRRC